MQPLTIYTAMNPAMFFMRLGGGELQLLSTMLEIGDPLLQQPANSMVFHSGQAGGGGGKLITESNNMVEPIMKARASHVPPLRQIVKLTALPIGYGLRMYESPGLIEPMSPGEVILCLHEELLRIGGRRTEFIPCPWLCTP